MSEKIKLLIIDDEVDFLDAVSERLTDRGFEVTKAADGFKAMEAAGKKAYDIALLDLNMPGMDGFEVLKRLKDEHDYIEVIILTGHGSENAAFETSKIGAYDFLTKPYKFDELIDKISKAYQNRLKRKIDSQEELLNQIMSKYGAIAGGAGSGLDMLEELRKLDDDRK